MTRGETNEDVIVNRTQALVNEYQSDMHARDRSIERVTASVSARKTAFCERYAPSAR